MHLILKTSHVVPPSLTPLPMQEIHETDQASQLSQCYTFVDQYMSIGVPCIGTEIN
jgi:hypothetical protein